MEHSITVSDKSDLEESNGRIFQLQQSSNKGKNVYESLKSVKPVIYYSSHQSDRMLSVKLVSNFFSSTYLTLCLQNTESQ